MDPAFKIKYIESHFGQYGDQYQNDITDEKTINAIYLLCISGEIDETIELTKEGCYYVGLYFTHSLSLDNNGSDLAIKYYKKAAKTGHLRAINFLGMYYANFESEAKTKKYYQLGIDKNDSNAMFNLGEYYECQNDYDNMKKYYLMAIERKHLLAMCRLGYHYEQIGDFRNMMKYYLMYAYYIDKCNKKISLDLNEYMTEKSVTYLIKLYTSIESKKIQLADMNRKLNYVDFL